MTAISPLQRWRRDDWVIPCTLQDPSGTAINLAGAIIAAELWLAGYNIFQPLTVSNGGVNRVSDPDGKFAVIAPRALTAQARHDIDDPSSTTRVLIYMIDSYGRRQTLGVVPFDVFDGSESRSIDEVPQVTLVSQSTTLQIVVAAAQGLPGPTNISAAQITDGGALGRELLQSPDVAAALALLSVSPNHRVGVRNADYEIKAGETYIGMTLMTAPRTITLPLATAYPTGQALFIADESGSCSTENPIIIAINGDGDDTIAGQSSITIESPYQKIALHSNGTNLWTI